MKKLVFACALLAASISMARAEDVKIENPYWDALSVDEQAHITDILKATKLLEKSDQLVSTPGESADSAAIQEFKLKLPSLPKLPFPVPGLHEVCQAACDVAAATAAAACSGSAIVVAACLAAVEIGRQECRKHC